MTADTSVPSTALLTGADRDGSNYTARHLLVLEAEATQAPRHVHRLDRQPRSDALPVGDHRQLRGRGPRGYCDHIEVILHDDASVKVRDNGRGIPVDNVEPRQACRASRS